MSSELEALTYEECIALIAPQPVGRVGIVVDGQPLVFPVNFRLVARHSDEPLIVLRTRPGNVISQSGERCAFEVDGIDTAEHTGWSVLVQGLLRHVEPLTVADESWVDPKPWSDEVERTDWLVIVPVTITGRRLRVSPYDWAFSWRGYL